MKYYIGIDNGVSGGICILNEKGNVQLYEKTPIRKCLNYTKEKQFINRISGNDLLGMLEPFIDNCICVIERPMINPMRWKASVSAIRCDEATLIVLEVLNIPYQYIDSKEWQKIMLPKRTTIPKTKKGASIEEKLILKKQRTKYQAETKILSMNVGKRIFPNIIFDKDADSALIAEWARRTNL